MNETKTHRYNFLVVPEWLQRIAKAAEAEGISTAEFIRLGADARLRSAESKRAEAG